MAVAGAGLGLPCLKNCSKFVVLCSLVAKAVLRFTARLARFRRNTCLEHEVQQDTCEPRGGVPRFGSNFVMRSFGKRPNSAGVGLIFQPDRPAMQCRVIERTLRIVRISTVDPWSVGERFALVLGNGNERVFCRTVTIEDDYVMARYSAQEDGTDIGVTGSGTTLGEVERWRGST
jgi:hypothetical protein